MARKSPLILALGLALVVLALAAGVFFRKISVQVGNQIYPARGPVLTVGQALRAAGLSMDPADRVEPALESLVPLDGKILLTRALQVLVWENGQVQLVRGGQPDQSAAALLEQAGIILGPADRLTWNGKEISHDTRLSGGEPITLQLERARAVIIDANGRRVKIDTTAATVAAALWQAGIQVGPADALSAPPQTLLADLAKETPSGPPIITYRTAQPVTILVSGQQIHTLTTAGTVGKALAEAGVSLQVLDYARPAENEPLPEDGQIRVVRVREEINLREELIPFENTTTPDASLEQGQTRITKPGQYGVKVTRERAVFEDGQEVSRGVDSDWTASEPVAQKVGVGTKVVARSAGTPDGAIDYWREVRVWATSYSPCNQGLDHCTTGTASGMQLTKGVIAVPYSWYLKYKGQRVYVTGYGYGVIGDTGGMTGNWIDLGFDEESFKTQAFTGWTTIYFLNPAP